MINRALSRDLRCRSRHLRPARLQLAFTLLMVGALLGASGPARSEEARVTNANPRPGRIGAWVAAAMDRIHLPPRVKRAVDGPLCLARGYCTRAADRLEAKLPRKLAAGFHKLRLFSPGGLSAFAMAKFKQDPAFLGGFGVASTVFFNLIEIPALIGSGMNPAVAMVVHELTENPVNLAVLVWRQHHLRADRSQSFAGTMRGLGHEYASFAETRREESRRFMAARDVRAGRGPTLGVLAQTLDHAHP